MSGIESSSSPPSPPPPDVLMLGTGEYTTGFTGEGAAKSDKPTGIVALVCLDLKKNGKIGRLGMCGTSGRKLPKIREHMQNVLGPEVYSNISNPNEIETWPKNESPDAPAEPQAYIEALKTYKPGDIAIVFTPDDTHLDISLACMEAGLHVMIAKPVVKTLKEHRMLMDAAAKKNVLCCIEFHKRLDPIYVDACDRIQNVGPFSYFHAYMSQPKIQLDTFKSWAGISSDISYYLNSHHIDFLAWVLRGRARPLMVTALASTGYAEKKLGHPCDDTITLSVQWENISDKTQGHSVFTSSWIAPTSDVHSQQRWHYMGQGGEIVVDQAHRGYSQSMDEVGYKSVNPLFWKPMPSNGKFKGQRCYGYLSLSEFIEAANSIRSGEASPVSFDNEQATIHTTACVTAILEGGRRSLDSKGTSHQFLYDDDSSSVPCDIVSL